LAVVAALIATAYFVDDNGTFKQAAAPPQPPPRVEVIASKTSAQGLFKFEMPATLRPGPTEFILDNTTGEETEFQLIQLAGGHTIDEFLLILGSEEAARIPDWAKAGGGVGSTEALEQRSAIVDLKPGRYGYYSLTAPQGPNGPTAPPQFRRGGQGHFQVAGEHNSAAMPEASVSITAKEYGFDIKGLKAGTQQVTFANAGSQAHHVRMAPFNKGATLTRIKEFITTDDPPTGAPPTALAIAPGTAVVDSGTRQVDTITLEPGTYAFFCIGIDRAGGPVHAAKGMVQEVKIA
jgi:hypothetical protein